MTYFILNAVVEWAQAKDSVAASPEYRAALGVLIEAVRVVRKFH